MKKPDKKLLEILRSGRHPETRQCELFLVNCASEASFNAFGYISRRKGEKAYDINGHIIVGAFPVFVSENEYGVRLQEKIKKRLLRPYSYGF